ncbi:MAG: YgeY family selenium metabolism-linked hydrolase [Elusimicrobia bacterium]|nr:YgeY family selenium metabolism-linked hydrolase [Elusimicrobiota bacterium]
MDRTKALGRILERDRGRMVEFLRDIIALPSPSGGEGKVARRTVQEMKACGFAKAFVDKIGNAVGVMGSGKPVILFDAHMDTVGIHDRSLWKCDPYKGKVDAKYVYGRGAAENKGALASIIYGAKAMREAGLLAGTVIVTGSTLEEDCDGLGLWYALAKTGLKPEAVVIGKFTELKVMRGQRGRMEIQATVPGRSCHASTPQEGVNPIYAALPLIAGIEKLDPRLKRDAFLGKGTIAVTQISVKSPGFNRLGHEVRLSIDRRLTAGETKELALRQIRALPGAKGAKVETLFYEKPASTGLVQKTEKYFPGWSMPEDCRVVRAAKRAAAAALGAPPVVDKWTVSSNGVSSCGLLGIPSVGFGPGEKRFLHNYEDRIAIADLVKAARFYALYPGAYQASK